MKRLIALLLALLMMTAAAAADSLPVDFTPGHVADPANYTESTYEDESLQVTMYREWVDDACFNVAHVKIADASQLRTALSADFGKNKTNRISTIARNNNAVVAIGGDYYADRDKGYVVRQGVAWRMTKDQTKDALFIDQNGDFHIIIDSDSDAMNALVSQGLTPINVFSFGPALVIDGELQEMPEKYVFNLKGTEPRCAIGQIGPLEYLLVVVDGRKAKAPTEDGGTKASKGCSAATLAQFMLDQGCVQAYNLDGGNSALMVFNGENYSAKSFSAERSVSDIIYFATSVDSGLDEEAQK